MAANNHSEENSREATVRAGERVIYQGRKFDLRKLMFAIHCLQSGVNPLNGTPLTSNKGGAS